MRCSRRAQNHPWRKVETKQTYYGWRFHSLSTCAASLSLFWTRTPLASLFLYARCAGEDSKHYLLLCKEDRQAGGCGGGRVKVPQEISWTGKKILLSDSNFSETLKHFLLDSDTKTRLSSLGQPVENMCGIFYVTEICFFFFLLPKIRTWES